MKHLNTIKKVIKLPFGLLVGLTLLPIVFFMTNFQDQYDVRNFKKLIKDLLW